ncbi:MFS transporter [Chloroflexota bacterium]
MIEKDRPRFFYGYVIVIAAILIMITAHGAMSSFGVFIKPFSTEFGWSRATISLASSICVFLMGFLSIAAGGLTDKFGPRIVLIVCGVILSLGYLLVSQVNAIWQLYFFYMIIGIGETPTNVSLLSTTARWFVKRRGIMSGIVKVGTGLGMLLIPVMVNRLIENYDWRIAYIGLGILVFIVTVSMGSLLRRDPSQMGQTPDNEPQTSAGNINQFTGGLSLYQAVRTRQFWAVCVINLAILYCAQTFMVHIVPHAEHIGISSNSAAKILAIMGGVSIAGRLVMGYSADKIGTRKMVIGCFLIVLITLSSLQIVDDLWQIYMIAGIYGIAHGGFFTLMSPLVADLFGMKAHGIIFGITFFCGSIGGSLGAFVSGHIFDIINNYQLAFLICSAASIIGLLTAIFLKPVTEINKGGQDEPRKSN